MAKSKSVLTSEIENYDVELFAKLIGELEILNKLIMSNIIKLQKKLKVESIEFKDVSISSDLSVCQGKN